MSTKPSHPALTYLLVTGHRSLILAPGCRHIPLCLGRLGRFPHYDDALLEKKAARIRPTTGSGSVVGSGWLAPAVGLGTTAIRRENNHETLAPRCSTVGIRAKRLRRKARSSASAA